MKFLNLNVSINKKLLWINLSLFILLIISIEVTSFFMLKPPTFIEECVNCRGYAAHEQLGYYNMPNTSHVAIKTCNEKLCFKARYTYDNFGKRSIKMSQRDSTFVALFGCSFTFGEGLNDSDTLAAKLSEISRSNIYNFGRAASGPAFALAQARLENFSDQIHEKEGFGVFILTNFHHKRNFITSKMPWLWYTPSYKFDPKGNIIFEGPQKDSDFLTFQFVKFYNFLYKNSSFLKLLNRDFPAYTKAELDLMTVNILSSLKETFEKKTGGKFIVVSHVSAPIDTELSQLIRSKNIYLYEKPHSFAPHENLAVCDCDRHPNAIVNTVMAEQVLLAIQSYR